MFLIVYSFQRKHRDRLPFNISNMKEKHGFKGNYLIAKSKSETVGSWLVEDCEETIE